MARKETDAVVARALGIGLATTHRTRSQVDAVTLDNISRARRHKSSFIECGEAQRLSGNDAAT